MSILGIIGAMDIEVALLKEQMAGLTETTKAGMPFFLGTLQGQQAVVARCGVGKVNAALCAQILIDCFGVTHLVNTGIAGSLCPDLDIGDLVVSQDAMYHDFDCTHFGYPQGQVPGMPRTFPADETLLAYAFAAAEAVHPGHVKVGRVASGDLFVSREERKSAIVSLTSGLCTEMEGAGIAQAAYVNQVPFVILRAISDKADSGAEVDYPTFEAAAARRCAAVAMGVAQRMAEAEAEA